MKTIKLHCAGGLGNRIRTMNSLYNWYYTENADTDVKIVIYWVIGSDLNASFEDLFDPLPNAQIKNIKKKSYSFLCYKLQFALKFKWSPLKKNVFYNIKYISLNLKDIKNKYIHIYTFHQFYKIDKSYVEFNKSVIDRVHFPKCRYIGVHIRQGDNKNAIINSPVILFKKKINELLLKDNALMFYLCTDSEKIKAELMEDFPLNIISENHQLNRNTLEGIYCAAADMLILSKAEYIIGSFYSSFSEVAVQFHHIPLYILTNKNSTT